jgi:hypothetical protein
MHHDGCGAGGDALRQGCEVARIDEDVRHDAVFGAEVMLRQPRVVEAERVGAQDFTGHARVRVVVRVGLGVRVGVRREQDAEFHARFLPKLCAHDPIVSGDAPRGMQG